MNFLGMCNEKITIVRQEDGCRYENLAALFSGTMILVPNAEVPIAPNDIILRQLPSGIEEKYIVTDPGFYSQNHGMPAHYQVKYRRGGQESSKSAAYNLNIHGNNSRINIHSVDNSNVFNTEYHVDMLQLAKELEQLREKLLLHAKTPENYAAIGTISSAEIAAKDGDKTKLQQALSALGVGAKWVLDIAKDIGVQIAATAITKFVDRNS